jgi:fructokinase
MLDVVAFGEILWDVIDGEAHIGGAPFNLAAHAARCGLCAATVSCVGDDALGHAALNEMARLGVDQRWTSMDGAHPTGIVTVTLQDGQPSYTIHENVAWDFTGLDDEALRRLRDEHFRAICFGTLAQRSDISRKTLGKILDAARGAVVFYDVNLRQSYWSAPLVEAGLARATIVKVNDEEARVLGQTLFGGACTPETFADAVLKRHGSARVVLVTLGADGCYVREAGRGGQRIPGEKVEVVDTVGAGDAFSAAFLAAWLNGADARDAAKAGNLRGAWVASHRGAVPEEEPCSTGIPAREKGERKSSRAKMPVVQGE